MTRLSETNLNILRQKPQSSKLYLSIFVPTAIFKAQVNDAGAETGDRVITFDSVSLGVYTYIRNGMTMWVGSTPGGQDLGKIRVRSATNSTITVSENNNINWIDNAYLTVFNYWELWPVFPRIIQDPNNAENVIFYKDYDITYTNQNDVLGTYVNAGPHRAAFINPASGTAQIYYSSTGSYNLLQEALTYQWVFEGAMTTGSTSANPGYISYNQPGHYVTYLSVLGASGELDTTYRYVSIYNQANPPIQKWRLDSLQGSRDEGGYTASITVFDTIPLDEHAVVVIFADNSYGNQQINLGGNFPNASDILFTGYIDKDTIQYDYQHSEVQFDALSLTGIMKKSQGFSVSVKSVANPNKWYKLKDMDTKRALYHYLRWHTTALNIADFQFVGEGDWKIQYFDSDRGSMFDAIDNYMQNTLIGQVVSDRQGKVWLETQAMAYTNPTGSFIPPVMDITTRDWMNTPNLEERLTDDSSYLEYGGVAYSGIHTGTFKAIIGSAPGNAPGFYGEIDNHEGMALQSQRQLNLVVGNIYANRNSQYPTIGLDLTENATNLDIAPQETVEVHLSSGSTVRNVKVDGLYIPNDISLRYDSGNQMLLHTVDFKQLVNGIGGETVRIPAPEDVGGGYTLPPLTLPPLPDIFPPSTSTAGDGAPPKVLTWDVVAGLLYTETFNTDTPIWFQVNGGLTMAQYQAINKIVVCPSGVIYVGHISTNANAFIARAVSATTGWTVLLDNTSLDALTGLPFSAIGTFNCKPDTAEDLAMILGAGGVFNLVYTGKESSWTLKQTLPGPDASGTDISFGGTPTRWVVSGGIFSGGPQGHWWVLSADASSTTSSGGWTIGIEDYLNSRHVRASNTGFTYHWIGQGNTLALGINNMSTRVEGIVPAIGSGFASQADIFEVDSTGVFLSGVSVGSTNAVKSSDGGYSWTVVGVLPVLQTWVWAVSKLESQKWIGVSRGGYVYYTDNFWSTNPHDKRGNLAFVVAIPDLRIVKILPT